jgi:hypothetical protein
MDSPFPCPSNHTFSPIGAIINLSVPILIRKILLFLFDSHGVHSREIFIIKPAYRIGTLALLGGISGCAVFRSGSPLGSDLGAILGILIRAIIDNLQIRKAR